jgi:hypothetical protein
MSSTINIFASGNVLSEEDLSKLAQEQAISTTGNGSPTGGGTTSAEDSCTVHVIRHGKRGSHCLQVSNGSTIASVMGMLSEQTGESDVWNIVNNTFSLRMDGGPLRDDCSGNTELTPGDHTLIVSPKVAGGIS